MKGRRWLIVAAATAVAALFLGRWLALETAERLWAGALGPAAGQVYADARAVARWTRFAVFTLAAVWGVGNLYVVYRAIGSVQVPRRLGDLEIVEAVSQRALLAAAVLAGLLIAVILTLGTGDWWLLGVLARAGVRFGVPDPLLQRDLGYYVAELPFELTLQQAALVATGTLTVSCALLYYGIGSVRVTDGKLLTSSHARSHLGALMALTAVAIAWGGRLLGPGWVAGFHGPASPQLLDAVRPAAWLLVLAAGLAAALSTLWAWWGRHRVLAVAWAAVLAAWLGARVVAPLAARGGDGSADLALAEARFTRLAFGLEAVEEDSLRGATEPAAAGVQAALALLPLWDPARVTAAARDTQRRAPSGIALVPTPAGRAARPGWLLAVADSPPARGGAAPAHGQSLVAVDTDSADTLIFRRDLAPTGRDWFGPGAPAYAVLVQPGDVAHRFAIPLDRLGRRIALAWALQSTELLTPPPDQARLLWRRDAAERIHRLAAFADFEAPVPVPADGGGGLLWVAHGLVATDAFPLVRPVTWQGLPVRYLRIGFLATVDAATGETRVYQAPGADSLSAALARVFAPLVLPAESLPASLRAAPVPYPVSAFRAQARALVRLVGGERSDDWRALPHDPYELLAQELGEPRVWTGQAFVVGSPRRLAAIVGATYAPEGARLRVLFGRAADRVERELVGAGDTVPGVLRTWAAQGTPVSVQARFTEAAESGGARPRLETVHVTVGDRLVTGTSLREALVQLGRPRPRPREPTDTTLEARLRALVARADSALRAGDLQGFARAYEELKRELRLPASPLARPPRPR